MVGKRPEVISSFFDRILSLHCLQSHLLALCTQGHLLFSWTTFSLLVGFTLLLGPRLTHLFLVDAHTAHHLFEKCIKGELMRGRTVILVSHHVQLCAPDAKYIVGRIAFCIKQHSHKSSLGGSRERSPDVLWTFCSLHEFKRDEESHSIAKRGHRGWRA